ncbi:MAG TPA: hypothetical protein VIK28_03910, partial [Sedimentisphaerales bacterium]
ERQKLSGWSPPLPEQQKLSGWNPRLPEQQKLSGWNPRLPEQQKLSGWNPRLPERQNSRQQRRRAERKPRQNIPTSKSYTNFFSLFPFTTMIPGLKVFLFAFLLRVFGSL